MIADPHVTVIGSCDVALEDGFEQFPQPLAGQSSVTIDVGASCGQIRLAFDDLTLDPKANDNLRLYSDATMEHELISPIRDVNLPLAPISIPGSQVYVLLVSDGIDRHTSLRATVECVASPCQNGGTCIAPSGGGGHHRQQVADCTAEMLPARNAEVHAACCEDLAQDCNSGAPSACNADCAAMLVPYVRECTTTLAQTKDGRDLVPLLQSTVQMCDTQDYMCRCTEGWGGENCDQGRCYGVDCGEHGTCDRATGTCTCSPSFSGPRCETVVGDGFICTRTNWRSGIMPDQPPALTGRGDFARLCSAGYTFEEKCCTHCPKCGHSTDASLGPGECNAASDCSCSCRACDNPPVLIPCECPPGQVSRATNCECECE